MKIKPAKAGIIGCGNISGIYFAAKKVFPMLDIVACADLDAARSQAKAQEHGVRACSVKELLADAEIEIVLNLTIPRAHTEVNLAVLEAGKNVHLEKPLAVNKADGQKTIALAKKKGLRVGCAPDTFMGAGIQTCIKLIDDGWIGTPIGATAFMLCHGHEGWHPDPEFYYDIGGGPLLDMGPYYLTALIAMLGPVKRVCSSARASFDTRTITSKPKFGNVIKVQTPTHIAGVMDFASGAIGTMITSFDVWNSSLPRIEVYGSQGTLYCPDPNSFDGPVVVRRAGAKEGTVMPLTHIYAENSRGIGAADMAYALRSGRAHRASGELGYHVLDVMQSMLEASASSKYIELSSTCQRPAPLPMGLMHGTLDA